MSGLESFDGAAVPIAPSRSPAGVTHDSDIAVGLYRGMQLVRAVELAIESMHRQGRMSGSFHSSLGQEACAVGVCAALRASDLVTSTHRGHGHAVAKGVPIRSLFAELLGRSSGVSGGRGGSMHLHHRASGFYGETAIVAGGLPWAAGAAWARRRQGKKDVGVAFTGDGGFAQGLTHETLLLARYWSSPCLFVCENNGFAHSMPSHHLFGDYGTIARMVAATGISARYVDGRDVLAVHGAAEQLVADVRRSGAPAFLECGVYRVRPHSISDADYRYRPRAAGSDWLDSNDPVARLRATLEPEHGQRLEAIDAEVREEVAAKLAEAERDESTDLSVARRNVYASPELDGRE